MQREQTPIQHDGHRQTEIPREQTHHEHDQTGITGELNHRVNRPAEIPREQVPRLHDQTEIPGDHEHREVVAPEEEILMLIESRKKLVHPEPDLTDDFVIVCVRHPGLGVLTRMFFANEQMMNVYYWIGSLSHDPLFFQLTDYKNEICYPDDRIQQGVYNLRKTAENINMSRDGDVVFSNFATFGGNIDKAEKENNSNKDSEDEFELLESLRLIEKSYIVEEKLYEVRRANILDDMFEIYEQNGDLETTQFILLFKNEDATGEGVTRDAYTAFFEQLYSTFDGQAECVPRHKLSIKHLELFGKIVTHAFINYQIFPIKLCKASLKYFMFGSLNNNDLVTSYHKYLHSFESDLIKNFPNNSDLQPIIDILSSADLFVKPSKENIANLIVEAANVMLIRRPSFELTKIVNGMGSFWTNAGSSSLDAVYRCTVPTASVVIKLLDVDEKGPADQQITTWLHRFLRLIDFTDLIRFTRFVTGSHSIYPNQTISVKYVDRQKNYLKPTSKMCFQILYLPRGFSSLSNFTEIMLDAIRNEN
eukprot:TCONS_00038057-protein